MSVNTDWDDETTDTDVEVYVDEGEVDDVKPPVRRDPFEDDEDEDYEDPDDDYEPFEDDD